MPFYQTFFASLLLQVFVFMHLHMRPYRNRLINGMETASLCVTTFTLTGAVVFFTYPPPGCKSESVREGIAPDAVASLVEPSSSTSLLPDSNTLHAASANGGVSGAARLALFGAWTQVPVMISVMLAVLNVMLLVYFAYSIVKDLYVFKLLSKRRGFRGRRNGKDGDVGDDDGNDDDDDDDDVFGGDGGKGKDKEKQISMVPLSTGSPLGNPLFGGDYDDY